MNDILNFGYNYPGNVLEGLFIVFLSFFFGVLFLQSGCDKVFNFDDNLTFLKTHFQKTIFSNQIKFIFIVLTCLELITAFLFCLSLVFLFISGLSHQLINLFLLGVIMANITLCCLFLGQRIAKDYLGAANLTNYFLVALGSLFFFF